MTDRSQTSPNHFSQFLLIWFGEFLSIIGTGMTTFALGIYVFQQTRTASSYVFVLLCVFLPSFLLKPYGGVLADRYDRRLMIVLGDAGASIGLIFIFVMMFTGRIQLWHVYLGIARTSLPFVVSLSNHGYALRQVQAERSSANLTLSS